MNASTRGKGLQATPARPPRAPAAGKTRGIYVEKKEKIKTTDTEDDAPTLAPPSAARRPRGPAEARTRRPRGSEASLVVLKHKADITQTPSLFSSYTLKEAGCSAAEAAPTSAPFRSTPFSPPHHSQHEPADPREFEESDVLVDDDQPIRFGQPTFEIKPSNDIFIPVGPPRRARPRPRSPRRPRRTSRRAKEQLLRVLQEELRRGAVPAEPPNVYQVLCNLARHRGSSRYEVSKNRRKCLHARRRRPDEAMDELDSSETSIVVYDYD